MVFALKQSSVAVANVVVVVVVAAAAASVVAGFECTMDKSLSFNGVA